MQLHVKLKNRNEDYDATTEVTTSLLLNTAYLCKDLFLFFCFFLSTTIFAMTISQNEIKGTLPDEIINRADYHSCNDINILDSGRLITFVIGVY